MMKKKILILFCVLGLSLFGFGSAFATSITDVQFSNVSGALLQFDGSTHFNFLPNPGSTGDSLHPQFKITFETGGTGALLDLTGSIYGTFTIDAPSGNTATVSGPSGKYFIYDGAGSTFSADVVWNNISMQGTSGGINTNPTVAGNLTNVNYTGSNVDLLDLTGSLTATIAFTIQTPSGVDITYLRSHALNTAFSGDLVPIPPSAVLLGSGLLGLALLGIRRKRG